jgi:hypothetical protein
MSLLCIRVTGSLGTPELMLVIKASNLKPP